MKKDYEVQVDCVSCANELCEEVKKVSGVKNAEINFMAKKITIEFEDGVDINEVARVAKKAVNQLDDEFDIII